LLDFGDVKHIIYFFKKHKNFYKFGIYMYFLWNYGQTNLQEVLKKMKDNSKSKFSKGKLAKFFDKEGFYIVLFLCVCVVAITAVWVSRSGVKETPEQNNVSDVKENTTTDNTPIKEAATVNDAKEKTPATSDSKATTTQQQDNSSNKVAASTTGISTPAKTTSVPVSFKLGDPVKDGISKGNTLRDYSPEEPVCFEYPNYEWRTHAGLDVKGAEGTEVFASADGKVVDVRDDNDSAGGLGWTVVIDHNNGYQTVYSNLGELLDVSKNQTVKKGQKIGSIGSTSIYEMDAVAASSDEPLLSHLHFEVLKKGNDNTYSNVDPKQYLTMQN
jgi:murein DD-endopeptidase MepM/ murein hydrolase activator NlpD